MAGLGINVNVGTSGKPTDTNSFTNMEKYLKKISDILEKNTKLERAGLGGNSGGGILGTLTGAGAGSKALSFLGGLLGLTGEGILGLTQLQGDTNPDIQSFLDNKGYEFANVSVGEDRQRMVAKINEKTGEIEDLLTIEEAQQKGIVDSQGNVKKSLESNSDTLKELEDLYGKYHGDLVLTQTNQKDIGNATEKQLSLINEINNLLEEEKRQIKARMKSAKNKPVDVMTGMSISEEIQFQRSYVDNALKGSDNSKLLSKIDEANQSRGTGVPYLDFLNGLN